MKESDKLKKILTEIKKNDYIVPDNPDLNDIISEMLNFIGDTDPELRDDLINSILWKWRIMGVITKDQIMHILKTVIDENHLFFKIGEIDTDSVFTRTFSMLLIPVAFHLNNKTLFLDKDDVSEVKEVIKRYVSLESDFRGFVPQKGWAHSMAHAADAISYVGFSVHTEKSDLLELLELIRKMVLNKESVYICNEDERIATAFMIVYGRKMLSDEEIIGWLYSLKLTDELNTLPGDLYMQVNLKNFLRSLYFRTLKDKDKKEINKEILKILTEE